MKDIIKYSAMIFAVILLIYLGINIYNFKSKSDVKKTENYTQSVQKEDSKNSISIQEEKNQKEEIEQKEQNNSNNTNNQTSNSISEQNNNTNNKVEEEIKNSNRQFTATFYIGEKLYAENCTTTGNSCKVKSPTISTEGYEVLGWSTNSNSKTAEFANNSEITLNSDKTF